MKKRFLFGAFEPDAVEMTGGGKTGLAQCINVIPVTRGYKAIPGWGRAYVGANPITGVVASYTSVVGAINTKDNKGLPVDFISDTSNVYRADYSSATIASIGSLGDVRPLGLEGFRDFAQYGKYVLMASGADSAASALGYYEHGSSTAFASLTTSFKAKTVCAMRDFVVWGHTYDSVDLERRTRVRWSAFGDPFTYEPSVATQSDFQDLLSEAGTVQKVIGGNDAFIVCSNAVYMMSYVGPPTIMRFDLIHQNIGTLHPQSCVRIAGYLYLWSTNGFLRLGTQMGDVQYIGAGKVDDEFNRLLEGNADDAIKVVGHLDLWNQCIGWQYQRASGAGDGRTMAYHYPSGQWVATGERPGAYFVYGSDISDASESQTDSAINRMPTAVALATNGNLYAQNDLQQCAPVTLGTGFEELNPGGRAIVERVYFIGEGRANNLSTPVLTVTAIPNTLQQVLNPTSFESAGTWQSDAFWTGAGVGFNDGRFHKFEVQNNTTSRTPSEQFLGIEVVYHNRGEY